MRKQKQRILFLFNNIDDTIQGAPMRTTSADGGTNIWLNFINGLENKDIFISTQKGNKKKYLFKLKNKKIHFYEFTPFYTYTKIRLGFVEILLRTLLLPSKLWRKFKKIDYLVSSSDFWPDSIPAFFLKMRNRKLIWIAGFFLTAPAPWQKDNPYKGKRFLIGFFYWFTQLPVYFLIKRYADFVLVTSEPDVEKFITKKRDRSKIIVAQGGVKVGEAKKFLAGKSWIPLEKRKYDVCYLGRFHYQKGVLELIDIWQKVCQKRPKAKLVMIGIGPLENEVKEKIKKYGLEENVDLLGFKDGQEKYQIFKQAKIMVHPATYDSGGMASAEGMAWGLPVVGFDLECHQTYYPRGMIKAPRDNLNKFSEKIIQLLEDKKLYQKYSSEAVDLAQKVWDWHIRVDKIKAGIFHE